MKKISYYELLKMINDGNIPKKVNYKITGYLEDYVEYTAQYDRNDFTHYELTNHHRADENIHFYLNENYLESSMFEESILILEEEKKIPDKLTPFEAPFLKNDEPDIRFRLIIDRINEICDCLKNKGE